MSAPEDPVPHAVPPLLTGKPLLTGVGGFLGWMAHRAVLGVREWEATGGVWEKGTKAAFRDRPGQGEGDEVGVGGSEEGGEGRGGAVGS